MTIQIVSTQKVSGVLRSAGFHASYEDEHWPYQRNEGFCVEKYEEWIKRESNWAGRGRWEVTGVKITHAWASHRHRGIEEHTPGESIRKLEQYQMALLRAGIECTLKQSLDQETARLIGGHLIATTYNVPEPVEPAKELKVKDYWNLQPGTELIGNGSWAGYRMIVIKVHDQKIHIKWYHRRKQEWIEANIRPESIDAVVEKETPNVGSDEHH